MEKEKALLIVWVYYKALGHLVEAMEAAAEYYDANPGVKIYLLLNKQTTFELIQCCPWISGSFSIDVKEVSLSGYESKCIQDIPKDWDYIVFPKRLKYSPEKWYTNELLRCNRTLQDFLKAKIWSGYQDDQSDLKFKKYVKFRINPLQPAIDWASQFCHPGLIFTVLLRGASGEKIYPSLLWWKKLLKTICAEFPGSRILITGVSSPDSKIGLNREYSLKRIFRLAKSLPNAILCYDIGLMNQLALLEVSDIFISPHSGFAFLALCTGTPWLAVSGGKWDDPTFARTPFYSVLPGCKYFPCHNNMKWECRVRLKLRGRIQCMRNSSNLRIHEFITGSKFLLQPELSFETAFNKYEEQVIVKNVDRGKIWRIDEFHKNLRMINQG